MTRVTGERGVVLHTRPYRESSLIVNILTAQHGRIAAVANGARGRRKGTSRGTELQPFNQLALAWSGRGSMVTLTSSEGVSHPWLQGEPMAAAFYVVELIMRLLAENESAPRLFAATVWAIDSLSAGDPTTEVVLRSFEKLLLEELGYAVDFGSDADLGTVLDPQVSYALVLERGFVAAANEQDVFAGSDLLAIGNDDYSLVSTRRAAKRIFRRLLDAQLGPKPLTSRLLLLRSER